MNIRIGLFCFILITLFFGYCNCLLSGTIHSVYGVLLYEDGSIAKNVTWEAFIKSRPNEVLSDHSPGSLYDVNTGYFVIQLAALSSWVAGETLQVYFYDNNNGTSFLQITLTYNPIDNADTLIWYFPKTQKIGLQSGKLNLVSSGINPSDPSVSEFFDDISSLLVVQDDAGHYYIPPYNVNTIESMDFARGYQLYYNDAVFDTIINTGYPLIADTISFSFLNTKLYMIGFPYLEAFSASEIFEYIRGSVVVVQDDNGHFWIPPYDINTINYLLPGKGYQIYCSKQTDFIFPAPINFKKSSNFLQEDPSDPVHFQFYETGSPYGIVVENSFISLEPSDEIAVFDGDLCVGAVVFEGECPFVIAAWEACIDYNLPGFTPGNPIDIRLWLSKMNQACKPIVEFKSPEESVFKGKAISALTIISFDEKNQHSLGQENLYAYPNPFYDKVSVQYIINDAGLVQCTIYNLNGQEINCLINQVQTVNTYQLAWNGTDNTGKIVTAGIYLVVLKTGGKQIINKLIKLKI